MNIKANKKAVSLIVLCALAYFVAYIGRLSYSANIAMVCKYYTVNNVLIDNAKAGLVGTCLFSTYGAGQIINGLLCKKYNAKYSIFIGLFGSALMNFLVALTPRNQFYNICVFWLINGFLQSILWSSIIKTLNQTLPKKMLKVAVLVMSFPVTLGTFSTYGISALFSALNITFKAVFIVASVVLTVVAVVWFLFLDKIKTGCIENNDEEESAENPVNEKANSTNTLNSKTFIYMFCLLAVFAVANNFIKDGITTWMPKILEDKYSLGQSLSTFLTLFLPLVSVFGATIAILIHSKLKGIVLTCGALYGVSALLIMAVVIFLNLPVWIITLVCFMLVSMCMSGVNNVLTALFPISCPKTYNVGLVAGVIDGFCYLGSAITTYALGSVSESLGWNAVFGILLIVCAIMFLICIIYTIINKTKEKRNNI